VYKIIRVISNNFVLSKDKDDKEIIIRGLGIGFNKSQGDIVPEDKVEKIYRMDTPKQINHLTDLVESMPLDYITVCTQIIENAQLNLGKRLSQNIYITLTDHICFALERQKTGLEYKNEMLWEIKNFYPAEYAQGELAIALVKDRLGTQLSEDEVGFIALHIVNAELETGMGDMFSITKMIQGIIDIIENHYKITLNQDSLDYGRFITHLKFLGQRIFKNQTMQENDSDFTQMIRNLIQEKYPKDFLCAKRIQSYIQGNFGHLLSNEEMFFLMTHLGKLMKRKD
jgi:beta-glucoside operon transcriptional antiterminator